VGTVTVGVDAVSGSYTVTCATARTDRGIFELRDPKGYVLGRANVGTPYVSSALSFTIADWSADFAVGDTFSIAVTGSSTLKGYDFAADPAPPQVAAAVLGEDIDTIAGAAEPFAVATGPAIIAAGFPRVTRSAEITNGQADPVISLAVAQLARRGLVLRGAISARVLPAP
jgi:hypothetical protein